MIPHDLFARAAEYFQSGGFAMYPLAVLTIVMWTLIVYKLRWFRQEKGRETEPDRCLAALCAGTAPAAQGWQAAILSGYMERRCADPELNRAAMACLRSPFEARAMRHVGTILLLAAVAPLLGLLGTVTGMIATFDVISQFGTGNARALASGISEALMTTQTGLVAAVPGMLLGGLLYQRARRLGGRMEIFCIRVQESLDHDGLPGEQPPEAEETPRREPGLPPGRNGDRYAEAAS